MSKVLRIINIGDELLLGIRANGHLTYLGGELSLRGLNLTGASVVRDEAEDIEREFRQCWRDADLLVTTGGLGPTSDDNTREAVARALGLELEFDPWALEVLEKRLAHRGRKPTQNDLRQCYRIRGSEMIPNRLGTAPGLFLRKEGKVLVMLPGPSNELQHMFRHDVLPRLQNEGLLHQEEAYHQLRTTGISESQLQELVQPVVARYPGMGVAFCAHQGIVDLRLSAGKAGLSRAALEDISRELRTLLGGDFLCTGRGTMPRIVIDQLRSMEKTLAIAESCTGGQLSNAFTDIPGVSKTFLGGVICYTNDTKVELLGVPECVLHQHGAVSEEVAVAMASGVCERLGADYGLSITGYAGPEGGTPQNPVGTVYIGYQSPVGVWAHKVVFPGDRLMVKARAVNAALDFMRRKLNKYKLAEYLNELVKPTH